MSSRPLAALASLILAVLGFVFLLPPDCASACSCAMPSGRQKERVEFAVSDSEAVFAGKVVKIDRPSPIISTSDPETVSFRVSESWKGQEAGTLEVRTPVYGASCGYPFKEGQEYLVYAYGGQQGLKVDLCSETKRLSKAGADLALLGDGQKSKDDGDEILSDTSGGISARAIAGMAGLLMAASLVVVVRLVRTG
jgi:hypothetical protein